MQLSVFLRCVTTTDLVSCWLGIEDGTDLSPGCCHTQTHQSPTSRQMQDSSLNTTLFHMWLQFAQLWHHVKCELQWSAVNITVTWSTGIPHVSFSLLWRHLRLKTECFKYWLQCSVVTNQHVEGCAYPGRLTSVRQHYSLCDVCQNFNAVIVANNVQQYVHPNKHGQPMICRPSCFM